MDIDWISIGGFAAVLGFMWKVQADIHRDIDGLCDRMAGLEGRIIRLEEQVKLLIQRVERLEAKS